MKSVVCQCSQCKKPSQVEITHEGQTVNCPVCHQTWGTVTAFAKLFEACPFCGGRQFWVQKDFNRGLGCLIVLIGICLVPKTHGLSLPFFALIDWLIYRRVKSFVVCYRCSAEFRGFFIPNHFKPFMHHIGLKYDKYR